jgi:hypothetical protein
MSLRALRDIFRRIGNFHLFLADQIGRIGSFLVSVILRRPGDWLASRLSSLGLRPGYVQQRGMLILTDIGPGDEPGNQVALRFTLEKIRSRLMGFRRNSQQISFYNTTTVHYAAWLILPGLVDDQGKQVGPAKLAFETNYDGCLKDHLQDLVDNCRRELDEVYGYHPDYPSRNSNKSLVKEFLCARYQNTGRSIHTSAYWIALPGRDLKDIKNAIAVYHEAKRFLDNPADRCSDLRSALVDHFNNMAEGAPEKPKRFPITQNGVRRLFVWNMTVLTLLFLEVPTVLIRRFCWWEGLTGLDKIVIAALMLLCLMPWLYMLRWIPIDVIARYFENKDERQERNHELVDSTLHTPEYSHLDLGRQNHLCTYVTVKPGWFRMFVIRRALWLGTVLFNYFFLFGKLDQIGTIHFGRWTLIGQHLLFCGNYDGSWSNYLADFSDEAWGVNLVWSNTIGFPATRFISWGGARNLEAFQAQVAKHYAPAPVFYSAYRDYSLVNLVRYLEFRDKLYDEMNAVPVCQRLRSLLALE